MTGFVSLVGAGPGDPELLTRKGERLLRSADAVLYDELANPALLALAPPESERCYVGKRAHCHSLPQSEIAAWMIARARRGLRVVRLKGGDPMIFGRGGEEIAALDAAGIPWEVVPGVSAATGVAAAAGIALTERGVSAGVRWVSGHSPITAQPAPGSETLVLFMAAAHLEPRMEELQQAGWAPGTPVAVIERGTLGAERRLDSTVAGIAAAAAAARVESPALVIVGAVAVPRRQYRQSFSAPAPAPGLILMAHGSPLPGGQLGVERLARELAAPGQFTRAAFLPPVRPSLGEAVTAAYENGVRTLAVVPYFLAPGRHVACDLPELVAAERRRYPGLHIELGECLEGHPALRTAVLARAQEALALQ
ncbi:MAG: uroporphyrinogen-III C-methyltransferase [Terriglobales bacterium]